MNPPNGLDNGVDISSGVHDDRLTTTALQIDTDRARAEARHEDIDGGGWIIEESDGFTAVSMRVCRAEAEDIQAKVYQECLDDPKGAESAESDNCSY